MRITKREDKKHFNSVELKNEQILVMAKLIAQRMANYFINKKTNKR